MGNFENPIIENRKNPDGNHNKSVIFSHFPKEDEWQPPFSMIVFLDYSREMIIFADESPPQGNKMPYLLLFCYPCNDSGGLLY